jgi:hypothetical protein
MGILVILLVLMIPILAIVLDSSIAKALAQRISAGPLPAGDRATQERLAFLESEVERLTSDLGRLEEESQFMHRLLTERSSASDEPGTPPSGTGGPS